MLKKKKINVLSSRQKKLLFKCTHRGTKELDVLLGRYVSYNISSFNVDQLSDLEVILDLNDLYLFNILTNKEKINNNINKKLIKSIIKFNNNVNKYK